MARLATQMVWALAWLILAATASADAGVDYLHVPGGPFVSVLPQGASPSAAEPVRIEPFALRAAPVTRAEFLDFVVRHPSWQRGQAPAVFADASYLRDWASPTRLPGESADAAAAAVRRPVTQVSWFAARAFCEQEQARLPTWLEWEFAAAADAVRADARSDPQWQRGILAWYARPASATAAPVGGTANLWGLRDLHGLIWEWVEDFNALFIAADSRTQGDPDLLQFCGAGAISVIDRQSYAVLMRIALLASLGGADSTSSLGFRCARSLQGD